MHVFFVLLCFQDFPTLNPKSLLRGMGIWSSVSSVLFIKNTKNVYNLSWFNDRNCFKICWSKHYLYKAVFSSMWNEISIEFWSRHDCELWSLKKKLRKRQSWAFEQCIWIQKYLFLIFIGLIIQIHIISENKICLKFYHYSSTKISR